MGMPVVHPKAIDGGDPRNVRGDAITGERFYSREFMQKEWDHMWKRVWHVAGRENEIPEPGDYMVHDFMHESVICVRQDDGSVRAFYNACGHRGQRLAWDDGHIDAFTCPYHGWVWGKDGLLEDLPDPDDFPQGNPCGKLRLKELQCDSWGSMVWYTMDPNAPPLLEYLDPIPELYKNWPMDRLVRVTNMRIEMACNWKFASENFSESYHTRTAHPQVPVWIDQDHWTSVHEMFPNGHGRIVQPGRPSLRDRLPEGEPHPFDDILRAWDIDPDQYPDFDTKVMKGWEDLQKAKKEKWREKGYLHYEHMTPTELTDSPHNVVFPNVTLSFLPDDVILFRTEPHPDDPNKCYFDLWHMVFPVEGVTEAQTMAGPQPVEEAERVHRVFDQGRGVPEMHGQIVFQDMMLAEGQQRGWRSQGYEDAYLAGQETRVRRWHEVLNDYLEGRR
jgi:phenylpropionate dioxygenase-like ring-hydroxylating dioxygenase large terminal subunit